MAVLTAQSPTVTSFPSAQVEARLREELSASIKQMAKFKKIPLPASAGALARASFQIDSLICVEILCTVEPVVGFELPEKVVKAGGYRSIDSAIENLMPRIRMEWVKKHGAV